MFNYIALVSQTSQVKNWEVQMVAAALQIQVSRDFTPIWGVDATVSAFDQLEDVPSGYWPILIQDDIGFAGAAGIHLDQNKKPFGLVQFSNRWSITASHEILEILVDPMGNRMISAPSIVPEQGIVEYLVEVCDPSEAEEFTYQINGVLVSDFYTPDFFLPISSGNVRYSFSGAIQSPRKILKGGYISWRVPSTDHWWQQKWFEGNTPELIDFGVQNTADESPRTVIDRLTMLDRQKPTAWFGLPKTGKMMKEQAKLFKVANVTNQFRAATLMQEIDDIKAKAQLNVKTQPQTRVI
ncbi:hypothetical protein L4174_008985 [Photobacterium sp. CCB-ST2H9]|uniref:hypothetical protein n=1 Tax=Photobacterium sp. CCB-ST2H9 TaxID=2912855 RepID=UPI00200382AA|nr:hypothetical protein [Photobacterium sp. CCB-ST2H9]UTM55991.1 hypothetical protein L4174_008985 [Photobacterium sp. CCB-ST2H9]